MILGALTELSTAIGDPMLLLAARRIADAATSRLVTPSGVLKEPCEPGCNADQLLFKGIFVWNLSELSRAAGNAYLPFLQRQANAVWDLDRDALNRFGLSGSGLSDSTEAQRQASAEDALTAALP